MGMVSVAGTQGYESVIEAFAESSFKLDFEQINKEFLAFLPPLPARVLDAGCGVGQNAAALAKRGYDVVAIEPLPSFLNKAISQYSHLDINWIVDSLPELKHISVDGALFCFILLDGVWHHLSPDERKASLKRFSELLSIGGICAISLRHGPAGAGTHVFPSSSIELCEYAEALGFTAVFIAEHLPSKLPNKAHVTWSKVALKKQ